MPSGIGLAVLLIDRCIIILVECFRGLCCFFRLHILSYLIGDKDPNGEPLTGLWMVRLNTSTYVNSQLRFMMENPRIIIIIIISVINLEKIEDQNMYGN